MSNSTEQAGRPREILKQVSDAFPGAWELADEFRAERPKGDPTWPNYVFIPMQGWYTLMGRLYGRDSGDLDRNLLMQSTSLAALGAWRCGRDIFRFDPELYTALIDTPLSGEIPSDILFRIPSFSMYLETPGLRFIWITV